MSDNRSQYYSPMLITSRKYSLWDSTIIAIQQAAVTTLRKDQRSYPATSEGKKHIKRTTLITPIHSLVLMPKTGANYEQRDNGRFESSSQLVPLQI